MAMTGMVFPEFVFELDNPCQCEGCCRKISRVVERLEGVCEYRFEKKRLILKGTNIDPSNVIRRLLKIKKHVRFIGIVFPNHQLPPPPPAEQRPPCMADQHCPPHHPVHACCNNEPPPPSPACHCSHPPPQSNVQCHGPPQGQVHVHFNEPRPPSSAFHCPPPHHECNHVNALRRHESMNDAPGSPLIPRNTCPAELLGQLGNMNNLKQVDLIKKQGIKLTFEDGRVTSWHPTYSMELRPGFDRDLQHLPPRYISPFSYENPNALCSLM